MASFQIVQRNVSCRKSHLAFLTVLLCISVILIRADVKSDDDDVPICDYGIQVICRYRQFKFQYGHSNTYLYACVGEKVQCYNFSNETKIWEYICPPHTNIDVEAFVLAKAKLIRFPSNVERYFPNLKSIDLYHNNITHISNNDLLPHRGLEYISLWDNEIVSLDADLFDGLPNLKVVIFTNNHIKYIGHEIQFPNTMIDLRENYCIHKSAIENELDVELLKFRVHADCPPKISQIEKEFENRENLLTSLKKRVELLEKLEGIHYPTSTATPSTDDAINTADMCRSIDRI